MIPVPTFTLRVRVSSVLSKPFILMHSVALIAYRVWDSNRRIKELGPSLKVIDNA